MRITRLRLKDFRGIDQREIELAPLGVTVVQGPNEIGKSSMAEGLNLLLEHLDSSVRKEVKEVRPVGRDAGPEVEADIETGPYAFTYRKRFLRDRETVLRITRPRPEDLAGREAHERVQSMLEETLDPALWKALRITQGAEVGDIRLGGIPSLSAALDAAAGTTPLADAELSLYERARAEYGTYWTDTGRPRAEAAELERDVASRSAELEGIEAALRKLDDDVAAVERLNAERASLDGRRAEDQELAEELRERWRTVAGIQKQVETAEARLEVARLASGQAAGAVEARAELVAAVERDRAERERWAAAASRAAPALKSARDRVEVASAALAGAAKARAAAERALALVRDDVDHLADRVAILTLRDQRERLQEAREGLTRAESILAANWVTDGTLKALQAARLELETARARLQAGAPTLTVESLGAELIELDGQPLGLALGVTEQRPVLGRLRIEVPGAVRLEVRAGADGADLRRALEAAETAFAEACERAGVVDLATAEAAAAVRREAEAARAAHGHTLEAVLRDLGEKSTDALDARIALKERTVEAYVQARPVEPVLPPDQGSARAAVAPAEAALAEARTAEEQARSEEAAARGRLAKVEAVAVETEVHLKVAGEHLGAGEATLDRARRQSSDEALAARHEKVRATERLAEAAAHEARATLEREGPAALRARLDNAEAVLAGADQRLRAVEDELLAVRTRLRDHQEDGLSEQRDQAIVARDVAERGLATYRRRAAARRLLYETLTAAREEAHRAYIGPLREHIEKLGRVVYGETFRVELSQDLRIVTRTLDGQTVPFESLSIGTKEQLGVIARLACAIIVARDDGAPLILDDTLGFSDPGRLEAMGAVLGLAGSSCQVIALTCHPDRYRHVGGATIRRLG